MGSDMTKEEFRQLCKAAWEKQHGFVIIDLSSKMHNGKCRSGLDEFSYQIQLKTKNKYYFRFTKWRIFLNKLYIIQNHGYRFKL